MWRAMASGKPRGEGTGISSAGAMGSAQLPSSPQAKVTSWPTSWKARATRFARDHGPPIRERATMGTTRTFTIQGYAAHNRALTLSERHKPAPASFCLSGMRPG